MMCRWGGLDTCWIDRRPSPERAALLAELADEIACVLATLTPREREIVRLRWGLGGCGRHTLLEVARTFRVTQERARQIEWKALHKLGREPRRGRLCEWLEVLGSDRKTTQRDSSAVKVHALVRCQKMTRPQTPPPPTPTPAPAPAHQAAAHGGKRYRVTFAGCPPCEVDAADGADAKAK